MSLDEVSVALKLKSADIANLNNIQKALESIEKIDKKIDFKAFAKGVATIDWETLGKSAAESVNKNVELAKEKIDTVSSTLVQMMQDMAQMQQVLGVPIASLQAAIEGMFERLTAAMSAFSTRVSTNFAGQTRRLGAIGGKVDEISTDIKIAMDSIKTSIGELPTPITAENMAEVVTSIRETMQEIAENISGQIKTGAGGTNMEEVAEAFKDTSTSINGLAESFHDFLTEMHSIITIMSSFTPRGPPGPPPGGAGAALAAPIVPPTKQEVEELPPKPKRKGPALDAWMEQYNDAMAAGKKVEYPGMPPTVVSPSRALVEEAAPAAKPVPTPIEAVATTFEKQKEEWMKRAAGMEGPQLEIFKKYLERMENRLVDMAKSQKENNENTKQLLRKREMSMARGIKRKEVEGL